ncbi:hypothetical protein C8Q79DRAFT_539029 [Trametes meyenii]|nr:hypothetical protein C8Q79DRAFT_539029 [Trametes meyenii]
MHALRSAPGHSTARCSASGSCDAGGRRRNRSPRIFCRRPHAGAHSTDISSLRHLPDWDGRSSRSVPDQSASRASLSARRLSLAVPRTVPPERESAAVVCRRPSPHSPTRSPRNASLSAARTPFPSRTRSPPVLACLSRLAPPRAPFCSSCDSLVPPLRPRPVACPPTRVSLALSSSSSPSPSTRPIASTSQSQPELWRCDYRRAFLMSASDRASSSATLPFISSIRPIHALAMAIRPAHPNHITRHLIAPSPSFLSPC